MARPKKMLGLQTGHLTKEQIAEREMQENLIQTGSEQLEKAPSWLRDGVAKKEWHRLVEQFKVLSVISNLDLNNLGAYCNAYSCYIEATKELNKQPFTIEYTNKVGAINVTENPLIKIQIKYSDEMKKYSSLLGLTIDSRLKMASIKAEKVKDEISDKYGDI